MLDLYSDKLIIDDNLRIPNIPDIIQDIYPILNQPGIIHCYLQIFHAEQKITIWPDVCKFNSKIQNTNILKFIYILLLLSVHDIYLPGPLNCDVFIYCEYFFIPLGFMISFGMRCNMSMAKLKFHIGSDVSRTMRSSHIFFNLKSYKKQKQNNKRKIQESIGKFNNRAV